MKVKPKPPATGPVATRKAYFCYQLYGEVPKPVIYYDSLPNVSANGKEASVKIAKSHLIPPEFIENDEVTLSFSALIAKYPYDGPINVLQKSVSATTINQQMEKKMPEPVTGFLTANGKFFTTQEEASFYEASFDLTEAATGAVRNFLPDGGLGLEKSDITNMAMSLTSFVWDNKDTIKNFIAAKEAMTTVTGQENHGTTAAAEHLSEVDERSVEVP